MKLSNFRVKIGGCFPVYPLKPVTLENDQSFVITSVTVPTWSTADGAPIYSQPGELFNLRVGGKLQFSWPLELLLLSYRRYATGKLPDVFEEVQRCLKEATRKLTDRLMASSGDVQTALEMDAVAQLLKSFTFAAGDYFASPGLVLEHPVLVPPRAEVSVSCTRGAPIVAYLGGTREVEVG